MRPTLDTVDIKSIEVRENAFWYAPDRLPEISASLLPASTILGLFEDAELPKLAEAAETLPVELATEITEGKRHIFRGHRDYIVAGLLTDLASQKSAGCEQFDSFTDRHYYAVRPDTARLNLQVSQLWAKEAGRLLGWRESRDNIDQKVSIDCALARIAKIDLNSGASREQVEQYSKESVAYLVGNVGLRSFFEGTERMSSVLTIR